MMLLTCCGLGKIPFAPGTWGSLAAALAAAILINFGIDRGHLYFVLFLLTASSAVLFWFGVKASDSYMAETNTSDPGLIVIDEWVGQMIATLVFVIGMCLTGTIGGTFNQAVFVQYHGVEKWLIGGLLQGGLFILFRYYDITKPWHAGWADSEVPGGMGVMLDDVFAGLYAGLTALVFGWIIAAVI